MEGSGTTCGLWLLVFLSGWGLLSAFNLDIENAQQKKGEPGSLFGFSMAMHWQLQPEDKRMLLVGAPRAKALSGQKSQITGGLYNCDMTSDSASCVRVNFDNEENTRTESKENQWMGVTVNSQGPGGKIVTCAHRYQRRTNVNTALESRDIIGRCVVLAQDLTINSGYGDEGDHWHFCESRPRGHEMFGSCQQGLSATFDKQYHYLIFGAPGAYNWKGIVRLEQKNDTLLELGIYDDGPFEVGGETDKDPELVPAPPNSYLGFSLDSGTKLTNKDGRLTVVAGAPRANHSGAVVLLKKGDSGNILLEEYTLEGEGLASSFGYDVTVLDLNGDGWQDIVVGAPQYFEKNGEIGGAVYVYVNQAGKWNKVKPTRIDGPQNSMFGLAVANLGDINQDQYHDFAVGAPYEDEGAGKVFIYHGSATGLKSKEAAQILPSPPGIKLFGYSLAGNMDLDKNSYPDLAVGSLSDAVFVYRARPVISIKKEIKFTPREIDLTKKNCGNKFCMDIDTCLTYTANPPSYAPKLKLAYSLKADADNKEKGLKSRATFADSTDFESKGVVSMGSKGAKECFKKQIMIDEETIQDKLRAIPIDVSVNIQDSKRKRRQSSAEALSPVLDANEPATTRSMLQFRKEGCGTDNVCRSNLQVKYRYGHRPIDGDTFTPLGLENGVPVISLSNQKDVVLEVQVTNMKGDDAHEASLNASFPKSLNYAAYRVPTNERQISCTANKEGTHLGCKLGNPFRRDAQAVIYIYLSTVGISLDTTELEVNLEPKTTSDQPKIAPVKAKAKVAIMLQLSVTGIAQPSQLYFSGDVKGEAAMKTEKDIGSAVTHQFRITNLGKRLTGFGTATLNIDWPKETETGKWLLYLMRVSATGVEGMQCTPKTEFNPLNKEAVSKSNSRRSRRAAVDKGTISRLIDEKKQRTLSCDSGAKCVRIRCPLGGLDSNAVVTLTSRLWNSTFIEDFSELQYTEVIVKASLHIDSTVKNTVLQNAEAETSLTVFPERRAEGSYAGVPWWIIVLSILFGLMLLALLAFLLWKCGFFERAKYEDKVPSYNAVRIKREERVINPGTGNWESPEKKPWMTTWHEKEHYS